VAYALLGTTATGVVPIVVPLAISRLGSAADVGLVMAAISLGGLTAPLWGGLADRYRLHRWLLAGGCVVTALGMALLPFTTTRAAWLGLGLSSWVSAWLGPPPWPICLWWKSIPRPNETSGSPGCTPFTTVVT